MKFKVGDIVKITRPNDIWHMTGKVGIIVFKGSSFDWFVKIDDDDSYPYGEDELKKVVPVGQQMEFDFM